VNVSIGHVITVLAGKMTLQDLHDLIADTDRPQEDRTQDLADWIKVAQPHLPHRGHSKITLTRLTRFLWQYRGWFKVKDFATHFEVHNKTAWEYLVALHKADLIQHNQERSSRARYRIDLPGALNI
jgi:hypothetical protein